MRLAALLLAPFAFTTGAFVFAGVLGALASDLDVSLSTAGQLQSAFAIASALVGPPLALLTARLERRRLLVATLLYVAAMNVASALATSYVLLFAIRLAAGALGALTLPLASSMAVALVGPERRARALAVVYAGVSLAFLSGIPLGSAVGEVFGWRATFWMAAALCAFAGLAIRAAVPRVEPPPAPPGGAFRAVLTWPTTGFLLVTYLGFTTIFTTVGYVGPIIGALTGFGGTGVGALQLLTGFGSILGLVIGTRLAERGARRSITGTFFFMGVSQALFSLGLLNGWMGMTGIGIAAAGMFIGSTALFGNAPVVQSRLAVAAGPAATLAFALNGSMVYLGQGSGVILGGVILNAAGLTYVSLGGIAVAMLGIGLSFALAARMRVSSAASAGSAEERRPRRT